MCSGQTREGFDRECMGGDMLGTQKMAASIKKVKNFGTGEASTGVVSWLTFCIIGSGRWLDPK